ncbi:uncharacterized protein Z520_05643 [Fonsecaea multimorphosa CBS 102226]|uniref:Apoptosis regulator Bcl-2 family BH4 domain-containing protein n=1 Tax=Fonsecaea multimorphosa CBS 102226 TaxID=1442371 RepID=A0A0D2JXT8_9EURO|nr:uncharacterized protein Z520_05643 [Fonsecaea multimorphosa CBS 102226]KIX98342.1 hypothetical protein Z520_05643 [Fonsecaea multimorphosa CBS 102226]OAL24537.1 hypothetical protein AYO22_05326 [Fonsecaea multimorphosa]
MFSSLTSFSPFGRGLGRSSTSSVNAIAIPAVEVHDVETSTDKRGRALKHLLKLNHVNFSILFNQLRFHNHTPHILGSAYLFSSSADHLHAIYEDAAANEGHEHWVDSPSEIAPHDYRDYLGKREYQRAFVDFFEDQLVLAGYDWKRVVEKFLFERGNAKKGEPNAQPIFNCLTAGLGHPLIHLGYAYELNSREVAMEALGLAATCYDEKLAILLETATSASTSASQSANKPLTYSTNNLFEVFARIHGDSRLDGVFEHLGGDNLTHLLSDPALTSILLEHFRAWQIVDPTKDFAQSQALATALLIASGPSVGGHGWDFFLVHLLTTSHAVRILIPFLPDSQHHVPLVREWLLISLAIYIAQLRPLIKTEYITEFDLQGRDWDNYVTRQAVEGKSKFSAHFVKACRAMREAERVWGGHADDDKYYLKAAVKFASEFDDWGGFGAEEMN